MVAHRSPKPLVWVRILVLLPKLMCYTKKGISMYSSFFKFYIIIIIVLTLASIFTFKYSTTHPEIIEEFSPSNFYWPLPENHKITSKFGKRHSPTSGASSYHSGIDIAAVEGTPIHSCFPGKVIFAAFKGAGGYTLTVENGSYQVSYCHISPNYIYKVGDYVTSNTILAYVGPKNVYGIQGNPYKDSTRKSYKWSNNRMSPSSNNKKRRPSRQSIRLFFILITIVIIPFNLENFATFWATHFIYFFIIICLKLKSTIWTRNEKIIIFKFDHLFKISYSLF